MYTIKDYLNFYKNESLDNMCWNQMDNMICALLTYLPIESFEDSKNINELYEHSKKNISTNHSSQLEPTVIEILNTIHNSIRYKELVTYNFKNILNEKTQFGAATFRIKKNTIIAYKGTDNSIIGWMENLRTVYEFPTYTQTLAINYFNENIKRFKDKCVYVVGHSKGGNLAIVSALKTPYYNKIKQIVNYDGPGLRENEFNSLEYNKIKSKIINILPSGSIIGVLQYNENYEYVKTTGIAFSEHYPTTWQIFGNYFIDNEKSQISTSLHELTTVKIKDFDDKKLKQYFESLYLEYKEQYPKSNIISFEEIIRIFRTSKNMDNEITDFIELFIKSIKQGLK